MTTMLTNDDRELMAARRANRRLAQGTAVVSTEDAEPGRIRAVCTFRRNGIDAWSYVVDTQYGREIWHSGDLFVVEV